MEKDMQCLAWNCHIFNAWCRERRLTDDNIEAMEPSTALISICDTTPHEDHSHHFSRNHDNVINLNFDDIETDTMRILPGGETEERKAMDSTQAEDLYNFIERNVAEGKNFIIHCGAGVSRSVAVQQFIKQIYHPRYGEPDAGSTPNMHVLSMLKRHKWLENGYNP